MPDLYPFLLLPIFDERPWGVRDLRPIYTKIVKEPIGESWLTWGDSCIANGPFAGRTLGEIAREYRRDLVGSAAVFEDRFPLLVKFLFPAEKLSVQVHPDDAGAQRVGQPYGKTECWYVLQAENGAQVALGLRTGTTLEEFEKSIREYRAEELLNWINVYEGDIIYVTAGTVHTIGGGMVLVETQQASDITYRLYDYGRPRELHIKEGIAAIKLDSKAGKVVPDSQGDPNVLVRSPFFEVEKMKLHEPLQAFVSRKSPHIVVAVDGSGIIESAGMEPISFAKGEAVVVPANVPWYTVRPQWELEVMRMSLPTGDVAEPRTMLG
ncbi:MAG TPA: type I phosphomannose isomerase catalytic subunit [Candidatus Limnocylindrales bacterium]|jgi:mannose-6-phosphate isomerase|nr:type I phosphomannose isomerase catalytic subunit [Candidatus Limnocylindrales bacterium]